MDRDRRHYQQPGSSLPSSLLHHLYSGPQQHIFSQSRTTTEAIHHSRDIGPLHLVFPPGGPSFYDQDCYRQGLPGLPDRPRYFDRGPPNILTTPLHALDAVTAHVSPPHYRNSDFISYTPASPPPQYKLPPLTNHCESFQLRDSWKEGEVNQPSLSHPAPCNDERSRHPGQGPSPGHSIYVDLHSPEACSGSDECDLLGPDRLAIQERGQTGEGDKRIDAGSHLSDPLFNDVGIADGKEPLRGKKRLAEFVEMKEQRGSRKIAGACSYCRGKSDAMNNVPMLLLSPLLGRKLRCNGEEPCFNCTRRKLACEYVAIKRRGPGKVRKGCRSRKAGITETAEDEYPPEIRPYIIVFPLHSFGFHSSPSQ
jgi:hypothetical protein